MMDVASVVKNASYMLAKPGASSPTRSFLKMIGTDLFQMPG
jgi:hypothetical protein